MKLIFSANRSVWSVYRFGFVEFENRNCSGFLNPGPRTWESAGPLLPVGRSTGRSGRPVARLVLRLRLLLLCLIF
jgi:hypothetical protein